ncbi:MAG TPA: Asd/ArgC dimerization domain-containing protein [Thermoanaerobaculia bacterium]|jgi:aspartate-semialdehyde dehydrogenase|nr:Asd/ArgC dimerization domain-containing protein [Thermoanaerobaculia bacterium]
MSAIAIVHPGTLVGKELRESLESRLKTWRDIRLLSTDAEEVGVLTEVQGAAAMVQRYEPDSFKDVSTVYFCGPAEKNRPLYGNVPSSALVVVLSPDATLEDGVPVVAGVNSDAVASGPRLVSPHPAVVLLAHVLHPLRPMQPVDLVGTIVQPASAQGDPGIQELFEQTREIVAMIGRTPTPVYGAQLSFNLLPTASDSLPLSDMLQKVVPEMPPVPLQMVQGGIFHGMALSLHARFGGSPIPPTLQALRKALTAHPYLEMAEDPRHLGPIDSGSSEKVLVGTIRQDQAGGFWFWAVMDNLTRGTALNAIEIAEAAGG